MLSHTFTRCMCSNNSAFYKIGFVGLGSMGTHMSTHLMQKGHQLHVFDSSEKVSSEMKAKGAIVYSSCSNLARNMDFVITMLPHSEAVSAVYLEMTNFGISKETIFIDTSTIEPDLAQTLKKLIEVKGGHFVDAPVTGGVVAAEQATLTFMVGGRTQDFDAVRGVLECMGKHIMHCGECGMGQATKLCNNLLLGIATIGLAETMNLAMHLGLDAQTFLNALNASSGRSWISEECKLMPDRTTVSEDLASKCSGMSMTINKILAYLKMGSQVSEKMNAPMELGNRALKIFEKLSEHSLGERNFTVVFDYLRRKHDRAEEKQND